jgi:hypothetical protein
MEQALRRWSLSYGLGRIGSSDVSGEGCTACSTACDGVMILVLTLGTLHTSPHERCGVVGTGVRSAAPAPTSLPS